MRVQIQYTVPYNPEINDVAERINRTIRDKAKTVLLASRLSKKFWRDAALYAAYTTKRSPVANRKVTPYEAWTGRKPDVNNLSI